MQTHYVSIHRRNIMNKDNKLKYFIFGGLAVVALVVGYMAVTGQLTDEPDLAIEVSEDGIDVDTD